MGGLIGATTTNILGNIKLGLDLQGGFEVLYEVKAKDGEKITETTLSSTAEALNKRINALGVNEPSLQIEGNNRIRVQARQVFMIKIRPGKCFLQKPTYLSEMWKII